MLKHNSRFWPTWALTRDRNSIRCIEAATMAPWNAVHGRLPGSGRLPGTLQYIMFLVTSCLVHVTSPRGYLKNIFRYNIWYKYHICLIRRRSQMVAPPLKVLKEIVAAVRNSHCTAATIWVARALMNKPCDSFSSGKPQTQTQTQTQIIPKLRYYTVQYLKCRLHPLSTLISGAWRSPAQA